MEGKGCDSILFHNKPLKEHIFDEYGWPEGENNEYNARWFLRNLQLLHDNEASWTNGIRDAFVKFAEENNLKVEF